MPNALVQPQAHLTMRAQRAIETCLSAATFARQRGVGRFPIGSERSIVQKAASDMRWSAKCSQLQLCEYQSRVYYPAAAAGTEPNLLSLEWNSFTAFCRSVALKSGQRRSVKYSSA